MKKTIICFSTLLFLTTAFAEDYKWEAKITPSITTIKPTDGSPKYDTQGLTTALGYNWNNDQIEISATNTQAKSPINETSSTLSLGYEKSLWDYKDFSSTLKFSLSREFNAGNSANSYTLEPKFMYDIDGFQPFLSFAYSKDFNGGTATKEYSLGIKFEPLDSLAIQPSYFYVKDGSEKTNGIRLEVVKSFK